MIRVCPTLSRVRTTSSLLDPLREDFQGDGCFLNSEKFVMWLIFPASVPFLEDKGAIMVLIVSSWYSGVVGHLKKKCSLFCRVVYRNLLMHLMCSRSSVIFELIIMRSLVTVFLQLCQRLSSDVSHFQTSRLESLLDRNLSHDGTREVHKVGAANFVTFIVVIIFLLNIFPF